jgi:chaperonin GroES
MKVKPLGDRVLVKRLEPEVVKKGGIIIPDTAKEKPQKGIIVEVGPGKVDDQGKRIPMEVKKGDRILFGKYAGSEIQLGDEEHMIMREDDILAIIKEK